MITMKDHITEDENSVKRKQFMLTSKKVKCGFSNIVLICSSFVCSVAKSAYCSYRKPKLDFPVPVLV